MNSIKTEILGALMRNRLFYASFILFNETLINSSQLTLLIWFISGTLQTSFQFQFTTRKYKEQSEKDRTNLTSEPITTIKFKETYILIGLGAIISVFLFIIIIQQCKKSRSLKKKTFTGHTCDENVLQAESSFQDNRGTYSAVSEEYKANRSYQSINVEYIEINEDLEMHESNALSVFDAKERPPSITRSASLLCQPSNEVFIEQMSEESLLSANTSDPYLIPV